MPGIKILFDFLKMAEVEEILRTITTGFVHEIAWS